MEEKFVIHGGKPLKGEVSVSGAKNAAVAILPATLLASDVFTIENVPHIDDVIVLLNILKRLGAKIEFIKGRFSDVGVYLPGGCDIGTRPIDLHIKGLTALGAQVDTDYGVFHAVSNGLKGTEIYFDQVSVGATINIMLAAVRAKGTTVLINAA